MYRPNTQNLSSAHRTFEQHIDAVLREILKEVQLMRQQRQSDNLTAWKEQNPVLASRCGKAFDKLAELQNELIENLVEAVEELEGGYDGIFSLREFTDKYANVSTQLNNVMSTLKALRA